MTLTDDTPYVTPYLPSFSVDVFIPLFHTRVCLYPFLLFLSLSLSRLFLSRFFFFLRAYVPSSYFLVFTLSFFSIFFGFLPRFLAYSRAGSRHSRVRRSCRTEESRLTYDRLAEVETARFIYFSKLRRRTMEEHREV